MIFFGMSASMSLSHKIKGSNFNKKFCLNLPKLFDFIIFFIKKSIESISKENSIIFSSFFSNLFVFINYYCNNKPTWNCDVALKSIASIPFLPNALYIPSICNSSILVLSNLILSLIILPVKLR